MLDIQEVDKKFIKIMSESKKIFTNRYDLRNLEEFKYKMLANYFSQVYDYYFSKRLFQKYDNIISLEKTVQKIIEDLIAEYGSLENYTSLRKIDHFLTWHHITEHKTSERIIILGIRYNPDSRIFKQLFNYIFKTNEGLDSNEYFTVDYFSKTMKVKFASIEIKNMFISFVKERMEIIKTNRKDFGDEI